MRDQLCRMLQLGWRCAESGAAAGKARGGKWEVYSGGSLEVQT